MLNEVKHLRSLLQIGSKIGAETLRFAQGDKIFGAVRFILLRCMAAEARLSPTMLILFHSVNVGQGRAPAVFIALQ